MTKASKDKGARYEREVAQDFKAVGYDVVRTPNSGGLHIKGDLTGLDGFAIECKRQETAKIWDWLAQAESQAKPDEIPLLIFRRNRSKSYACLPLDDILKLIAAAKGVAYQ